MSPKTQKLVDEFNEWRKQKYGGLTFPVEEAQSTTQTVKQIVPMKNFFNTGNCLTIQRRDSINELRDCVVMLDDPVYDNTEKEHPAWRRGFEFAMKLQDEGK